MTRRTITKFAFSHIRLKDNEAKIDKITNNPGSSTYRIAYKVLKKMKDYVKQQKQNFR